jgi:hypothetical protein
MSARRASRRLTRGSSDVPKSSYGGPSGQAQESLLCASNGSTMVGPFAATASCSPFASRKAVSSRMLRPDVPAVVTAQLDDVIMPGGLGAFTPVDKRMRRRCAEARHERNWSKAGALWRCAVRRRAAQLYANGLAGTRRCLAQDQSPGTPGSILFSPPFPR